MAFYAAGRSSMRSGRLADMLKHLPKAYHAAKGLSKCRDCSANGDGRRPDLRPVSVASSRYLTATVHVVNSNDLDRSKQDAMPPRKLTLGQQLRGIPYFLQLGHSGVSPARVVRTRAHHLHRPPSPHHLHPTYPFTRRRARRRRTEETRRLMPLMCPACTIMHLPAGRIQGPP